MLDIAPDPKAGWEAVNACFALAEIATERRDRSVTAPSGSSNAAPPRHPLYSAVAFGNVQKAMQRYAEAEREYLQAQAENPETIDGELALGDLYAAWGDSDKAKACYQAVIKNDPTRD